MGNHLLNIILLFLDILVFHIHADEKKPLKVAIAIQPPFTEKYQDDNGNISYRGICIDLMAKIASIINYEYEIYEVPDGQMGTWNENQTGEWNGLIRELVDKKADVALAPLVVMADRAAYVDFTVPFYDPVGSTILMRKKEPAKDWFLFVRVFQPHVWGMIVAAYFTTSVLLWFFERFSPHSYRNDKSQFDPEAKDFTLKECLWVCLILWAPQGCGEPPKNTSGRFVLVAWWLFGFVCFATLTANFAALLFVPQLETPIRSLDDLAQQYKIKYAPIKGSPDELYFKRMAKIEDLLDEYWIKLSMNGSLDAHQRAELEIWDYPVSDKYNAIWKHMMDAHMPENLEEAVKRVEESSSPAEGFALVADSTVVRHQAMTNCEVEQIGGELGKRQYALATWKDSPLRNKISIAILQLRNERGMEALKTKWWDNHPDRKECPKEKLESDGLAIEDMTGIFVILLGCMIVSLLVSMMEYCYVKYKSTTPVVPINHRPQPPNLSEPSPIKKESIWSRRSLYLY